MIARAKQPAPIGDKIEIVNANVPVPEAVEVVANWMLGIVEAQDTAGTFEDAGRPEGGRNEHEDTNQTDRPGRQLRRHSARNAEAKAVDSMAV